MVLNVSNFLNNPIKHIRHFYQMCRLTLTRVRMHPRTCTRTQACTLTLNIPYTIPDSTDVFVAAVKVDAGALRIPDFMDVFVAPLIVDAGAFRIPDFTDVFVASLA